MQKSPVLKEKVQSEAGQLLRNCLILAKISDWRLSNRVAYKKIEFVYVRAGKKLVLEWKIYSVCVCLAICLPAKFIISFLLQIPWRFDVCLSPCVFPCYFFWRVSFSLLIFLTCVFFPVRRVDAFLFILLKIIFVKGYSDTKLFLPHFLLLRYLLMF